MWKVPILVSTLLFTPVADTVWWHTDGGSVVQHSTDQTATCTLTISNDQGRFEFVWDRDLPTRLIVSRRDWRFSPDQITSVAMRIGNVWIGGGNGSPNIAAMTGPSALMLVMNQPVEPLLLAANEIVVTSGTTRFGIILLAAKVKALVAALRSCRARIGAPPAG
jgi:hypothetical protein